MVQRGNTYVTGVNFKILANWTHLEAILTAGDLTGSTGDQLAQQTNQETAQQAAARHQAALERAAAMVDTSGAMSQAVLFVPVILVLLFVGLIIRQMT